jgi:hypothetical protein
MIAEVPPTRAKKKKFEFLTPIQDKKINNLLMKPVMQNTK